jgi:16S rRNA (cytosine1407-C5)-methyltransferase
MIYHQLPKKFIENMYKIFPTQTVEDIVLGMQSKRPTTFRTNTLKIKTPDLLKKLDQLDIKYQPIDWLPNTFVLVSDKKQLIESDPYANGLLYVQSLSSLLPVLILDPQENDTVLDQTAAPGSKTTQIAALMKNTGKILANDRHLIRLEKLKYNLKKQGVENVVVTNFQGQEIGEKHPNFFDKTLLDAPCSLEGTFQLDNPKSYQNWSGSLIEALSQRQKDLLFSAYKATKVGGTIVYSTCTLEIAENEEVVNWLIKKTGNQVAIEKIDLKIPEFIPGFTSGANQTFHPNLINTVRILPSEIFEGFYLAKLKKIA